MSEQIVHFFVALPASVDTNATKVLDANARFWKKGAKKSGGGGGASPPSSVEVSFYRLDNIPRGKVPVSHLHPVFMGTQNVSCLGNEWIHLNMSEAVKHWLSEPYIDNGILLRCADCNAAGVRFLTGGRKQSLTSGSKAPRLNVRTEVSGMRRAKRSHKLHGKNQKLADCHDATHAKGRKSKRCCRRSMQVRFVDLPKFDFILSPKEFDAFYCSGRCPPRYNPATHHSLFQSLVNLKNVPGGQHIPKPCCAPTKLKGLNILHIGEDGRMKTTFWSDVIVTECGCA